MNSWSDPHSGSWEVATNWSQGLRPASDETVEISNEGFKAVDISSATASGFPDSLTISNLTISAPTNSANTLLLNFVGYSASLQVLNGCTIGSNGTLANYYSSFQVDGDQLKQLVITDGGKFIQDGGVTAIKPTTQLYDGSINTTNSSLTLAVLGLGQNFLGTSGYLNQSGGTVLCDDLRIDRGTYTLADGGTLYSFGQTTLYNVLSHFDQFSGTNFGDLLIYGGYYHLYDGFLRGNHWSMTGNGNEAFFQHGGAVEFATMEVYGGQGGPNYQLESGTLHCGTLSIGGIFRQYGGTLTLTNGLQMTGGIYDLVGGTVLMPSMVISNSGVFNHFFGTNQVAGNVELDNTGLLFEGGRFSSANLGLGAGAAIGQMSGSNVVSGVLTIVGSYYMGSGVLSVNGLWLRGPLTLDFGRGNPDPLFLNSGTINFGGTINFSSYQNSMGQVILATNGTINLSASLLAVRFGDSSALNWDSNSRLMIAGWNGSYSGNGSNQLYFGNSGDGLTPDQLSLIRFSNPAGIPPGEYGARILSTGEIVPVPPPVLQTSRTENELVLTWPGDFELLTATNLAGPYLPVPAATSPYTNEMRTAPQRFFLLQSQ